MATIPTALPDDPAGSHAPEGAEATSPAAPSDPIADNKELQQALYKLLEKCQTEDRYARLMEVKEVKKARMYWRGNQYIWWSEQDQKYNIGTQGQLIDYSNLNIDDMPHFEFVTNIFQSRGLGFTAAVTGAPPKVRFFPKDAEDANDLETARADEKLAELIQRWNPTKKLLVDEAYFLWTDGTYGLHTEYVEDGEKYGFDSNEEIEEGETTTPDEVRCPKCGFSAPAEHFAPPAPCPDCGTELTEEDVAPGTTSAAPVSAGMAETPKGRQVIRVVGALNLKRPQWANGQSEYHYLIEAREVHYTVLRAANEDKAEEIKPGASFGTDDAFERNARLSVAQGTKMLTQTSGAQSVLVTYARCWFRPSVFWGIEDKGIREQLKELFPRGARVEFAGPTYLTSAAESMDDHWRIVHGMPGDGQHRPAAGTAMLPIQDRVNVFSNIQAETYEYGIPITYRDRKTFDETANEDQRAEPGSECPVNIMPGDDIRSKIMQVRADSVSPDMAKHTMDLFGPVADQISGVYPALEGTPDAKTDTFGGMAMQRDQAMGRMGIPYGEIKQAHADILMLACRDFRAHTSGKVSMPILGKSGDFEAQTVDVDALEGESECYPEGDETFPESWAQKGQRFMQIMDSPQGQQLMTEPDNADLATELIGLSELVIPGADVRRNTLKIILQLSKLPMPIEQAPQMMGMFIDPVVDAGDSPAIATTTKTFLRSDDGRQLKDENPVGYANVRAFLQAHMGLAKQQAEAAAKVPVKASATVNYKDLEPVAKAAAIKEILGIDLTPEDFLAQVALAKSAKPAPKPFAGKPAPGGEQPVGGPNGR